VSTAAIEPGLGAIEPRDWDRLGGHHDPCLSHGFLHALEQQGCVGGHTGWTPQHVVLRDAQGALTAAMPMYAKTHSYGEFVFDWAWASAYERAGGRYYPKLVVGVPFTPVSGRRLLVRPQEPQAEAWRDRLVAKAMAHAEAEGFSGVHWLFPSADDLPCLERHGLSLRMGCQYHWHNPGYQDFQAFLAALSASKRKKLRRERRRVAEQGIRLRRLRGNEIGADLWQRFYTFYHHTLATKMGYVPLTSGFFEAAGEALGDRVMLVVAEHQGETVAAALNLVASDALYGRYWGAARELHSLHFEACYYQGIEFAIEQGLARFEPGAQGEYKISRGFLPAPTWSAHWLRDQRLAAAVADFCGRERHALATRCEDLAEASPYRRTGS